MKTVIIPNDYHPFVIEVNGVKYTYPEGTEQSVPDEVASAIENYYKLQPKERPADGGVLPYVSGENNGEVLKVEDGAWKKSNGGLNESDFVMKQNGSTEDLTGFSAKDGTVYLPVIPEIGQRLKRFSSDGTTGLERETKLYVRNAASSGSPMTELAYEKKSVRYELGSAMLESLVETGTATETISIPYGVPTKLWDSITVAVGDAELYCRRMSPESTTEATYQGFVSEEQTFGEGIFSLDILVEKKPKSEVSFLLNFKKASGGGSSNHVHKINVLFNKSTFGPSGGLINGDANVMLSIPVDKVMTRDEFLQYLVDNGHTDSKPLWVLNSSDTSYIYETNGPVIYLLNILYVYYVNYGGVPTYIGAGGKAMKIDYQENPVKYTQLKTNYFTGDLSSGFLDVLIS